MPLSLVMLLLLSPRSHGWETDQLTRRSAPLTDIAEVANTQVNTALDRAAARASARLGPRSPAQRVHRVTARLVRHELSRAVRVPGRGAFRGLGYGAYTAWLETADLPRLAFVDRSDVYGDLPFGASPVLSTIGICSTVHLAGQHVGTDKIDHFFDTGWRYFRRSGPADPTRGVRWGTWTERTWYGWWTTNTFSRADLYANLQGWRFYAGLLSPSTGTLAAEGGEVRRVRAFHWQDWVDAHWDELLYPSTYRPRLGRHVEARIAARGPGACRDAAGLAIERSVLAPGPEPWIAERRVPAQDVFAPLLGCDAP